MRSHARRFARKARPLVAALTAGFAILARAACGGGVVRGQPPLVGISTVSTTGQGLQARVDIHNPNGVDMRVRRFNMAMTIGDARLGRHSDQPGINISPNGIEEIRFDFPPEEAALQTLSRLERGELNGVPYTIEGEVIDDEGETGKFRQQGYLYPVPGRPGQFRGAGPQRDVRRGPGRERNPP